MRFVRPGRGSRPGPWRLASPSDPAASPSPQLEAGFRAFAHQAGLTVDEGWSLSRAFHEAAAAEALWPHLDEETLAGKVADVEARLLREPDGAELLAGAQRLFRELRHRQPALAEHLVDVGAGTSLTFVKELGRVARRLGR